MDLSQRMQLVVDSEPGQIAVYVSGELNAATGPRLLRLLDDVVRRLSARAPGNDRRLRVDLSGVRLFATDGVAVLRHARHQCEVAGVAFRLTGIADRRGALPLRVERVLDEIESETAQPVS